MPARPKPGSRAERAALCEEMKQAGCSLAEIVMEMRARWRMRPREAWRQAHGWTLQQVADRIDVAAVNLPGSALASDASLVGKWERWPATAGRRPSLRALTLLADVYGCTVEDLLDLEDRRALPPEDLRLLHSPEPPAETTSTITVRPPDAAPPTGTELVHTAASESATWAQWAETTNVGDIALEQLLADTRTLAITYVTGDPLAVFSRARQLRDQVFSLLEGHQYPRQATDLYAMAGYLCGLLAWISSDLGQMRDADTQGRTAWLCAELAGHNELRAWVLSTRSKIALWDGRLREAINHARRGAAYDPQGTAGVLLACQEADAWSLLGAAEEARAAITRAADARDRVIGADEVAGIFSCMEFRRANYASAVLLRIGAPDEALREAEAAFTSREPRAYGTAAQVRIVQAAAHLALRQPDGAIATLRPVFALPPQQRLEPVARRIRELGAALARSPMADSAPAVGLQAEIEAWCLDSAPRVLALSRGEGSI
ncbi:helix-turn-helix transcriptional regulator [Streptosporangium roseum]|uniref:helix-turn-helix transcriptional regulator n=1 Tax=Streptosporangium roseum TaxID=2001 RepID=UPI00332E93CA